jgi:hypothetical protein
MKSRLIIVFMALMLLMVASVSAELIDDFNRADGPIAGTTTNQGYNWTSYTGDMQISSGYLYVNGNQLSAVEIDHDNANILEFSLMIPDLSSDAFIYILDDGNIPAFSFYTDGPDLMFYDDWSYARTVVSGFSASTWYKLGMKLDTATNSVSVYLDDNLLFDDGTSYSGGLTMFQPYGQSADYQFYIDDLETTSVAEPGDFTLDVSSGNSIGFNITGNTTIADINYADFNFNWGGTTFYSTAGFYTGTFYNINVANSDSRFCDTAYTSGGASTMDASGLNSFCFHSYEGIDYFFTVSNYQPATPSIDISIVDAAPVNSPVSINYVRPNQGLSSYSEFSTHTDMVMEGFGWAGFYADFVDTDGDATLNWSMNGAVVNNHPYQYDYYFNSYGNYSFELVLFDGESSDSLTWNVEVVPPNLAPYVEGVSDDRGNYYAAGSTITMTDAETVEFTPDATDADGTIVSYNWDGGNADPSSGSTRILYGTNFVVGGSYSLWVQAVDDDGATGGSSFPLEIVSSCVPDWACDSYDACGIADEQFCNGVIDNNACGESYTGDYSEFASQACDYCSPSWNCTAWDTCVSPAINASCTWVNDSNSCFATTGLASDAYTGDYSEFPVYDCVYPSSSSGGSGTSYLVDADGNIVGVKQNNAVQVFDTKKETPFLSIGGGSGFDLKTWFSNLIASIKGWFTK